MRVYARYAAGRFLQFLLVVFIGIAFVGLILRLAWIQVINPDRLRQEGDMRSLRTTSTQAVRGMITDRNGAAAEVLADQIKAGRRKIAIFYGAAHMDDFDEKLQREFQLQPRETVWLEAWDLRDPAERN
jgi:cell division protein FtsI/penicillin-binding protein 2